MKIAIMQPYFFPYIGYFQLISAVDRFVFLDDVKYIKKGWLNRNRILANNSANYINLPIVKASQNVNINQTEIGIRFSQWKLDLLKKIEYCYKKSPYFHDIFELTKIIIYSDVSNLAQFNIHSIKKICEYIKLETETFVSSSLGNSTILKGEDKILDLCQKLDGRTYYNPVSGFELYNDINFQQRDIELKFLKPGFTEYKQFKNHFVPELSIIDVLMFNSVIEVKHFLKNFEII